jgi:hypothetical protein
MRNRHVPFLLRLLWALPCTSVGACLVVLVILLGGTLRRVGHTLEIALSVTQRQVPPWAAGLDFAAITLGHIIVGQSHEVLAILRAHERVHVSQYERLGALFLVAYPASSLLAWLRGGSPYHGNRFEQQAVAQAAAQRNAG